MTAVVSCAKLSSTYFYPKIRSKLAQTWITSETIISNWFKFISYPPQRRIAPIFLSFSLWKSKNKQGIGAVVRQGEDNAVTLIFDERYLIARDCSRFFFQEEAEWYEVLLLRIFLEGFDRFFWVLFWIQLKNHWKWTVLRDAVSMTTVLPSLFNLAASATTASMIFHDTVNCKSNGSLAIFA